MLGILGVRRPLLAAQGTVGDDGVQRVAELDEDGGKQAHLIKRKAGSNKICHGGDGACQLKAAPRAQC